MGWVGALVSSPTVLAAVCGAVWQDLFKMKCALRVHFSLHSQEAEARESKVEASLHYIVRCYLKREKRKR
jgi:hypothetical protein